MGHPQPAPTPVATDNITAQGLTMGTMTPKSIQIERPTVQLVKKPQRTSPIQISLAERYSQSSRLCQLTPPGMTPSKRPPILRLRQRPIARTVKNQHASSLTTWEGVLNTHISKMDTKLCHLLLSKQPTYLVTTKLGRLQQYTLLIAITLAMSSAPWESS